MTYLQHRWRVFKSLLRIGDSKPYFIQVVPEQSDADLRNALEPVSRFTVSPPALRLIDRAIAAGAQYTPGFYGWFWLDLLFVDLAIALLLCRIPRMRPLAVVAAGLSVSGLAYTLAYFVASIAADFRYLYWSVMAATLASAILLGLAGAPRAWQRGYA